MSKFDTYNPVTRYIVALASSKGDFVSNKKLQKLLYYIQAYFVAVNEPLFPEDFQAWVHGPVLPEAYREFREFGFNPIVINDLTNPEEEIEEFERSFNNEELELLHDVVRFYFTKKSFELELLTHRESPWLDARGDLPMDAPSEEVITKESMARFYSQYIED